MEMDDSCKGQLKQEIAVHGYISAKKSTVSLQGESGSDDQWFLREARMTLCFSN